MPKRNKESYRVDHDRLAADVERAEGERLVQFSFRLPADKRDAFLKVARRRYETSAQRLLNAVIDQILGE